MNTTLLAQAELISLGTDPKTWIVVIGGALLVMIFGRFKQAFNNGAGLIDAVKAVIFGTNIPKPPPTPPPTSDKD